MSYCHGKKVKARRWLNQAVQIKWKIAVKKSLHWVKIYVSGGLDGMVLNLARKDYLER